MVVINITDDQRKRAEHHYKFHKLNNNITEGESEIYGSIGEIITYDYYKNKSIEWSYTKEDQYNWDMKIEGITIDVKTKRTTVVPLDHYFCSVAAANTKQNCDYYYFVRVTEDLNTGYLLGYLKKSEFFQKSIFKKKKENQMVMTGKLKGIVIT